MTGQPTAADPDLAAYPGRGRRRKRFLDTVIRIPATVAVRARAIVVRLLAYTVNVDRFFTAWASTERIRFRPASGLG